MDVFYNATIHTGSAVLNDHAVLVKDGSIEAILPAAAMPDLGVRHDLGGGILAPGFIDLQVNGGGGILFNDVPTLEGLKRIAAAHRKFGTTGLLPTIITDERPRRERAAQAVAEALASSVPGILGIHFEGPHLNPARRGIHKPDRMGIPDERDLAILTRNGETGRVLVTLAPEIVPAPIISELVAHGIRVSAGHTAATYAETRIGLAAGISGFTHLFNAMSQMSGREPGVVGAALEDRESWCGIIVDGHHVHPANVALAWHAKPKGKLFLVTDAMSPVGTADESFVLQGRPITVAGGRCVAEDGTLAGSCLDMASAVRNAVTLAGIPTDEAIRMASTYPSAYLGLDDRIGRIAPGCRADFVLLNTDLTVRETWIAGSA